MKQKELQKDPKNKFFNSAHYYGIWTFSSYLANTKLRVNRNYEIPSLPYNVYLTQYPTQYVDQIVGKTRFFLKFFGRDKSVWNNDFLGKRPNCDYADDIHSQSFFGKFMLTEKYKGLCLQAKEIKKKQD